MANTDKLVEDFEEIRKCLHDAFNDAVPELIAKLETFADELDASYKAVKVSKVTGSSACVVGGVLAAVGFGLSFVTFGASLGLCIAGAVIGGAGGITTGGATIAEYVKAKQAKRRAAEELEEFNKKVIEVLKKCEEISDELIKHWDIEKEFCAWFRFWNTMLFGPGVVAYNVGWKVVGSTVTKAIRLAKGIDFATDAASAGIPGFRALGAAARGIHITGGVIGVIFLPFDVYCLVSNAVEIHNNTSHKDAEEIRETVKEIKKNLSTREAIDQMIDSCVATVQAKRSVNPGQVSVELN